jgi:hypothetical protein
MQRDVWEKLGEDFLRQYREQANVARFSLDGKTALPKLPQARPAAATAAPVSPK